MGKKKKQEKEKKEKKQKEKLKKLEKAAQKAAETKKDKSDKKTAEKTAAGKTAVGKTAGRAAQRVAGKPARRQDRDGLSDMADRFRALGDENRLRILMLIGDGELCANDILKSMNIVQSTLSHHMKILTESGIVRCRRQGKRACYSVDKDTLRMLEYDGRGGNDYDEK